MKCLAVEVTLGKPKYCTNEVPVIFNGTDQYMLPSSGILTKKATKVACTSLTPVLYKVGHLWYKNNGKSLIRTLPPKKLKMEDTVDSRFSRLQGTKDICLLLQMSLIDNRILKEN